MKKAILLYNPKAGSRHIVEHLDYITKRVQCMGYELRFYRSEAQGAIEKYIDSYITEENTDMIIVSGGDGTINECVNGLARKGINIPIGILPLGTANDFASAAGIGTNIRCALDIIADQHTKYVDIGKVNDRYFINVCNMGLFSGVSHIIDPELKKNFGKLAYYVKGLEELHNYQAMNLMIETKEKTIEGKYLLVLIFNGKGAGGFNRLAKNASITDGKFDVVCIKNVDIFEIPRLFLKILQGEHFEDEGIEYLVTSQIDIQCYNQEDGFETDVDGEIGPKFPLQVKLIKERFRFYMPNNESTNIRKKEK